MIIFPPASAPALAFPGWMRSRKSFCTAIFSLLFRHFRKTFFYVECFLVSVVELFYGSYKKKFKLCRWLQRNDLIELCLLRQHITICRLSLITIKWKRWQLLNGTAWKRNQFNFSSSFSIAFAFRIVCRLVESDMNDCKMHFKQTNFYLFPFSSRFFLAVHSINWFYSSRSESLTHRSSSSKNWQQTQASAEAAAGKNLQFKSS